VLTGGEDDAMEGFRHGIGGNEPPDDFMELSDLFPGLRNEPGIAIPLAPIDSFLGISSVANQANLAATEAEYDKLFDQIRAMDPSFRYDMLQPLSEMNWQGRANTINDLLFIRAAVYYRVSGNRVDELVREQLKDSFNWNRVPFGPGQRVIVNNQDVSSLDQTYRRPDVRLGNVAIDWTLAQKTFSSSQIRGLFRADSQPDVVIIIRPSELGGQSIYAIARPPGPIRKVLQHDSPTGPFEYTELI
jgi:hypothetical protein